MTFFLQPSGGQLSVPTKLIQLWLQPTVFPCFASLSAWQAIDR